MIAFGSGPTIAFDANSGTTVTCPRPATICTKTIFSDGGFGASSIWASADAGSTFSSISGSPVSVKHMTVSNDGVLYVTDNTQSKTNAWKYTSSSWTNFTTVAPGQGNNWHSIASDHRLPGILFLGLPLEILTALITMERRGTDGIILRRIELPAIFLGWLLPRKIT